MRFSHAADCHLGAHRDPVLKALNEEAFTQFISESIAAKVEFILIAGDLFQTAMPGIDALKLAVTQLQRCRGASIRVYAIPGSHDYSSNGKTMLDILEAAGLLVNVAPQAPPQGEVELRLVADPSGTVITGVMGKRGMLDHEIYARLQPPHASGGIFLFHTAIAELVDVPGAMPLALLPKGFSYYAGGHVHVRTHTTMPGDGLIAYPGPLFPNNFSELEELEHGGYILYDQGTITHKPLALAPVARIELDATGMSSTEAAAALRAQAVPVDGAIALVRVHGTLSSGGLAELDLRGFARDLERAGARCVLRNVAGLTTKEFTAVVAETSGEDLELELLQQHARELELEGADGVALTRELLHALSSEPKDGERQNEYKDRVVQDALKALETVK